MIRELKELLKIDYGAWENAEKDFACPLIQKMFVGKSPEEISNDYHHNKDARSIKFSNGIKFTHYYACMNRQLKQNGIEIKEATCSMDDMFEAMKYMTIVEKAKDLMNPQMSGGSGVGVDESFKKTLDHFKKFFIGIEEPEETEGQMDIVEPEEPEETDEDVVLDLVSNALIQIGNVNDQSETNPVTLYAKGVNTYKNANKCVQDYINSVMNAITTKVISEREFTELTKASNESYDSFKVKISGYIDKTLSGLDNAHVMVTHYIEKNKDTIDLVEKKLGEYADHIRNYVVKEFKKNYTKDGVKQEEKDELDRTRKEEIKNLQTLLDETTRDTNYANEVTQATAELSAAITLLDNANKNLDAEKAKIALQKEHTQAKRADLIKQKRAKTPATTGTGTETETEPAITETGPEPPAITPSITETGPEPPAITETLGGGKKRRTKKQTRKTKRSKKQARKTKKSNKKNKTTKKRSTKNR